MINSVEALEGHPSFQKEHLEDFRQKWADFAKTDGKKLDKLLKDEGKLFHKLDKHFSIE